MLIVTVKHLSAEHSHQLVVPFCRTQLIFLHLNAYQTYFQGDQALLHSQSLAFADLGCALSADLGHDQSNYTSFRMRSDIDFYNIQAWPDSIKPPLMGTF